ncbi:hypothetical protein [Winogradskyella helgolandensis]|nr:hypothetical protein [Winogradskyella helgolandensis]
MKTFWTIAIPLFIGITFLVIKFFEGFMKKETTEKTGLQKCIIGTLY